MPFGQLVRDKANRPVITKCNGKLQFHIKSEVFDIALSSIDKRMNKDDKRHEISNRHTENAFWNIWENSRLTPESSGENGFWKLSKKTTKTLC